MEFYSDISEEEIKRTEIEKINNLISNYSTMNEKYKILINNENKIVNQTEKNTEN